ncbi:heavy metal translocating P-type ATPase [Taibaiella koreensis]|uniref:heavy metal translocating P-type ATPase n=1 Tax=Taibaiella koreensis TaxID=1268548 RepID=UPI001F08C773|nr:heavy metal translocating P-type ATPase [Taibaiella koreensis]
MQKLKINLNILLPEIPDERDACVARIIATLKGYKGIDEVHLSPATDKQEAQLCFHFDPDVISLKQVGEIAVKEGAVITHRYSHLLMEVNGIREMNQAAVLENELRALKGVMDVSVSAAGNIRVELNTEQTSQTAIEKIISGYGLKTLSSGDKNIAAPKSDGHNHKHDEAETDAEHEGHTHGADGARGFRKYAPVAISLVMLLAGIATDNLLKPAFFTGWVRLLWYAVAYLPVGLPVALQGIKLFVRGDVFTEFVLMTIATLGAFFIGEYPEGVAVMVFYTVGELFQDAAVNKAKRSIKALLDIRPAIAFVRKGDRFAEADPKEVAIGDVIRIKAGEKVPLDGEMLSEGSAFNTAALTGESRPSEIKKGEVVLAGMINQDKAVELKVTKLYNDSSLARILTMVQEATTRKATTEQFIRKFSRVYTPIVVVLAVCIALLPYFFVDDYIFKQWLYRALIFLVISCPCALVISIPLGYFGGIGAASRNGILFKGSNFLDLMTKVNTVIMDKTGTLTEGVFKVREVKSYTLGEAVWLPMAAALEAASTHPVARAVVSYAGETAGGIKVADLEEISGHGIRGTIDGKTVLAGNLKLMDKMKIPVDDSIRSIGDTIVVVAVDHKLAGYVTIADQIKEDSKEAIDALHGRNIKTVMLSGDKQAVVDKVASALGIDNAFGDLLPEGKVKKVEEIKADTSRVIAFVGDGVNDAPVLALSDVGMAMGGLGSDAAIETADVIIQTDQPSKITKAILIGVATNRVVWQNIVFAFVVKGIVLVLGAGGLATMWEAVFADVGVALLAIFNAMRIQKMKF